MNLKTYFNFSSTYLHSLSFAQMLLLLLILHMCFCFPWNVTKFPSKTWRLAGEWRRRRKERTLKLNYDDDEWFWQIEISIFAMTTDLCFEACKQTEQASFQNLSIKLRSEIGHEVVLNLLRIPSKLIDRFVCTICVQTLVNFWKINQLICRALAMLF